MANNKDFKMDDSYVTVAERIIEFREKYPKGSLQPWNFAEPYRLELVNGNQCFVVVAAAYRDADDTRPGIGMAYEPVPGATPYTRGSELQNAETAAWGRAIVAVLAADTKRGIASREEVRVQLERTTANEPEVNVEEYRSWFDAIEEWSKHPNKADAYQGLLNLYNEATQKNIPPVVKNAITAAGRKVNPNK